MKRLLCLLVLFALVSTYAHAIPQTIDLDTMTLEEMQALQLELDERIAAYLEEYGLEDETGVIKYVLNTNTKKFHFPHCNSVDQMKENHRKETSDSYDEVIASGYVPCKNCNPR